MKLIRKTGGAPSLLIKHEKIKSTSSFKPSYKNLDAPALKELREHLRVQQSNICAYCNQVLGDKTKIEHHCEQTICTDRTLDYTNIFLVCMGNEGQSPMHCDSSKSQFKVGNGLPIAFNPTIQSHIASVKYSQTGVIKSTNLQFDQEIDKILYLNHPNLLRLRRKKLTAYKRLLGDSPKRLTRTLEMELDNTPYKSDFPGLAEFFLKKYKK